jgi:NADH-quinone oxidoreductase subunit C
VPSMSPTELKERLMRDLPGALAPERPRAHHATNGHPPAEAEARPRGRKAEEGPVDLLATDDAVVLAERLPDVVMYVRDRLGYQLLSNLTAVDYLSDGVIEVVYHFVHLDGGPPLVIKVRVPREHAVVPSLTPFWPGANLQEREAYDLYGVQFPGHPNLTRIYMWDEFEGYPMRKDFPKQGDKYLTDEDEV